MSGRSLKTVSMVYPAFASLDIHVKPLEVIVQIYIAGTEVSTKQSRMRSKDSTNVEVALASEHQSN